MSGIDAVIDAGRLSERLEVLELRETEPGVWTWEAMRKTWAQVELDAGQRKNLFSSVGIGARNASLVLRRQEFTLHNALRWKGHHLFLTAILPRGRGHLDVTAALVRPETVQLVLDGEGQGVTFPGILTEKYLAHSQEWPMSVNDLELVLVVPKAITLRPGRLVECLGAAWEVLVPHELDEFKNEYEIGRRAEL